MLLQIQFCLPHAKRDDDVFATEAGGLAAPGKGWRWVRADPHPAQEANAGIRGGICSELQTPVPAWGRRCLPLRLGARGTCSGEVKAGDVTSQKSGVRYGGQKRSAEGLPKEPCCLVRGAGSK